MALIKSLLGHTPEFGEECFVAENATIIGQFKCGDGCSFWYGSVVRGDVNSITFGHKVNVQDNATVHCTYEKFPTVVGNNVSIGHNAIVHGCQLGSLSYLTSIASISIIWISSSFSMSSNQTASP